MLPLTNQKGSWEVSNSGSQKRSLTTDIRGGILFVLQDKNCIIILPCEIMLMYICLTWIFKITWYLYLTTFCHQKKKTFYAPDFPSQNKTGHCFHAVPKITSLFSEYQETVLHCVGPCSFTFKGTLLLSSSLDDHYLIKTEEADKSSAKWLLHLSRHRRCQTNETVAATLKYCCYTTVLQ